MFGVARAEEEAIEDAGVDPREELVGVSLRTFEVGARFEAFLVFVVG